MRLNDEYEFSRDDDEFLKQVCATIKEVIARSKNNKYLTKRVVHPDDKSMKVVIDLQEVTDEICELDIYYSFKCLQGTLDAWFFDTVYDFTKDELRRNKIDFRDSVTDTNVLYRFVWDRSSEKKLNVGDAYEFIEETVSSDGSFFSRVCYAIRSTIKQMVDDPTKTYEEIVRDSDPDIFVRVTGSKLTKYEDTVASLYITFSRALSYDKYDKDLFDSVWDFTCVELKSNGIKYFDSREREIRTVIFEFEWNDRRL